MKIPSKILVGGIEYDAEELKALIESIQNESSQSTTSSSDADEILKFKELLDAGVITEEEFEAKKKQILGV